MNKKYNKSQRGRGSKSDNVIKIFTTNATGLKSKLKSLSAQLKELNVPIFTVQETHFTSKGKINIDGYVVFESIRTNKKNGGTAIGVSETLNPILIEEYNGDMELLVVELKVNKREIRIISGYGPQENLSEEVRVDFYSKLDTEVERASLSGKEVIIAMDANAKLGPKWIPKDKHKICENGKLLENIIIKHGLVVGNSHVKCQGVITRRRVTTHRTEESTIDYIIMSAELATNVTSILIVEDQKYALTRITKTKSGVVIKRSDHNVILTELAIPWHSNKKNKKI